MFWHTRPTTIEQTRKSVGIILHLNSILDITQCTIIRKSCWVLWIFLVKIVHLNVPKLHTLYALVWVENRVSYGAKWIYMFIQFDKFIQPHLYKRLLFDCDRAAPKHVYITFSHNKILQTIPISLKLYLVSEFGKP